MLFFFSLVIYCLLFAYVFILCDVLTALDKLLIKATYLLTFINFDMAVDFVQTVNRLNSGASTWER